MKGSNWVSHLRLLQFCRGTRNCRVGTCPLSLQCVFCQCAFIDRGYFPQHLLLNVSG